MGSLGLGRESGKARRSQLNPVGTSCLVKTPECTIVGTDRKTRGSCKLRRRRAPIISRAMRPSRSATPGSKRGSTRSRRMARPSCAMTQSPVLGVGKNMVRSIRHWCLAAGIVQEATGEGARRSGSLEPTAFGRKIFGTEDGLDPIPRRPHDFMADSLEDCIKSEPSVHLALDV